MELYLIIKDSTVSEPIGYFISYDEAVDYISYLDNEDAKVEKYDRYIDKWYNCIKYRIEPLYRLEKPTKPVISEPIGISIGSNKVNDYISYLENEDTEIKKPVKYSDKKERLYKIEKAIDYSILIKRYEEYEKELQKIILEKKKYIEENNNKIETLKQLIYKLIEENNFNNNIKELKEYLYLTSDPKVKEYLYLTSDPKVVKWAFKNNIRY